MLCKYSQWTSTSILHARLPQLTFLDGNRVSTKMGSHDLAIPKHPTKLRRSIIRTKRRSFEVALSSYARMSSFLTWCMCWNIIIHLHDPHRIPTTSFWKTEVCTLFFYNVAQVHLHLTAPCFAKIQNDDFCLCVGCELRHPCVRSDQVQHGSSMIMTPHSSSSSAYRTGS